MFPWKHQPTEGEKELRSPDEKGTAEFYPHTVQQAELITRFAHLPWEDAVGVHGAVLLGGGASVHIHFCPRFVCSSKSKASLC